MYAHGSFLSWSAKKPIEFLSRLLKLLYLLQFPVDFHDLALERIGFAFLVTEKSFCQFCDSLDSCSYVTEVDWFMDWFRHGFGRWMKWRFVDLIEVLLQISTRLQFMLSIGESLLKSSFDVFCLGMYEKYFTIYDFVEAEISITVFWVLMAGHSPFRQNSVRGLSNKRWS